LQGGDHAIEGQNRGPQKRPKEGLVLPDVPPDKITPPDLAQPGEDEQPAMVTNLSIFDPPLCGSTEHLLLYFLKYTLSQY